MAPSLPFKRVRRQPERYGNFGRFEGEEVRAGLMLSEQTLLAARCQTSATYQARISPPGPWKATFITLSSADSSHYCTHVSCAG
jgi:hypothetical protein